MEWLRVLRAYPAYTRPSMFVIFLGKPLGSVFILAAFAMVILVAWQSKESGLAFSSAFAITVLLPAIPYQPYNDVMLLAPALWLLSSGNHKGHATQPLTTALLWLFFLASCGLIVFMMAATLLIPAHAWHYAKFLFTLACCIRPFTMFVAMAFVAFWPGRGEPAVSTRTVSCALA